MGREEWDRVLAQLERFHSAEFVRSFLFADVVNLESSFGVIKKTKVFSSLFDGDDIHETSWVLAVGPDLTVNSDGSAHHNLFDFIAVEGVLQSVTDEDGKRQALAELVGSGVGAESVDATGFWQHPVVGSRQGFEMFFRSSSAHFRTFLGSSAVSVSST